jgi:lipopolysaccharide biosynthesis glycosyltransferase
MIDVSERQLSVTDEVHVAFVVDRGFLNQVAVTIASIVANAAQPETLRFHIVHAEDQDLVAKQVARWGRPNVDTIRVQNPFSHMDLGGHRVSVAALLKTILPTALQHLARLIYLDADIVVLRDIAELWRVDLGGAPMAGVIDMGVYRRMARAEWHGDPSDRNRMAALGLSANRPQYVNSGLLLMDLDELRRINFSRTASEMNSNHRGARQFVDQDIINSALAGRIAILDPRWNVTLQSMSRRAQRRHHYLPEMLQNDLALQKSEQWAIHYTGPDKPWVSSGIWMEEKWWRYAPLSGLDWHRPVPVAPSLGGEIKEAVLDIRARLSAWWFRCRRRPPRDLPG